MTISTKEHPYLDRFILSAKAHGFKPKVYGLNEKKTYHDPLVGNANFGMKLRYVLEHSKSLKQNDIMMLTDAWDVLIVGDCDKVLKDYKSFKKDIVFGAELAILNFHEPLNLMKNDLSKPFPCLNSGAFIGKAGTIRKLLEKYCETEIADEIDDQAVWKKIYYENKNKIALDYYGKLILNTGLTNMSDYVYKNNILTYIATNTTPSIIHAQGHEAFGFKSYLDLIKY